MTLTRRCLSKRIDDNESRERDSKNHYDWYTNYPQEARSGQPRRPIYTHKDKAQPGHGGWEEQVTPMSKATLAHAPHKPTPQHLTRREGRLSRLDAFGRWPNSNRGGWALWIPVRRLGGLSGVIAGQYETMLFVLQAAKETLC